MPLGTARRHPIVTGLALLGGIAAAGWLAESRLDPAEWHPPDPPPMEGPLSPGDELVDAETVLRCDGPEDVAFDADDRLYTGTDDGRVVRTVDPVTAETTDAEVETFALTRGRPLGMTFDGEELLVCAEDAGLVSVDADGEVTTLSDAAGGRSIEFADDLHVADDGTVYFTDATRHDIFQDELFELADTGRLLAYHPDSGETTVELTGLGFANGVCPHVDGESLLVTETSRYRVIRYWIDGDRAGQQREFAANLVGYPDNVEAAGDGTYWVAIPSLRDEVLEALHEHPWVKRQLGKLPKATLQQISGDPYGLVLRLDGTGTVVESLHDPGGDVYGVTSATPKSDHDALYLGSLFGRSVTRYRLS